MSNMYMISGINGASKTTNAYKYIPEGIPYINPDKIHASKILAGKIAIELINKYLDDNLSFAFETTGSSKGYAKILDIAHMKGYNITLVYFYLNSVEEAIKRVDTRVKEGGHSVSSKDIERRYYRSLKNVFELYAPRSDNFVIVNASGDQVSKFKNFTGSLCNHDNSIDIS